MKSMRTSLSYAALLLLPLLGATTACNTSGTQADNEPYRTDWVTVADNVVFPGVCPPGELGCECDGNDCNSGTCQTLDGEDYCVDGNGPNGEAGQGCEGGAGGSCNAGLQCTPEGACVDIPDDQVGTITIGGNAVDDNFINRGDVEVYLTGPSNRITIQMRKFTNAPDQAAADENFDKLDIWAYTAAVAPPGEVDPETDCLPAWKNDCEVRAYFNGLTQPVRDGADFRVFLPADYTGAVRIVTEDMTVDEEYPARSDVRVVEGRGDIDISLESGVVEVQMADDITEAARCTQAQIEDCRTYENEDGEPEPWNPMCACTAAVGEFTGVKAVSRTEQPSNMTVQIPSGIWANAILQNTTQGLTPSSKPLCMAETLCDEFDECDPNQEFPWKSNTEVNDPGDSAPESAGFNVNLESAGCGAVLFVDGPEDFGSEPKTEDRGFLTVCSDCLDLEAIEP